MKNLFFLFFLFLFSCTQKENTINIAMQSELMKKDPIVMEYLEAIAASSKMITEGGTKVASFHATLKAQNQHPCSVKLENFQENAEFKKFANTQCKVLQTLRSLHEKYSFIQKMEKEDRRALFKPLVKQQEFNMDEIRKNTESQD